MTDPIRFREDFADLCNARQIVSAVEVGTDHGVFADAFLERWKFKGTLWCVDPYEPCEDQHYPREADFLMACMILSRHGNACRIVRERSVDAAEKYGEKWNPGFVYIDGAHDYKSAKADIAAWWPKVKLGGVLAGHDYSIAYAPGVVRAVEEFASAEGLRVELTEDHPASWWTERI